MGRDLARAAFSESVGPEIAVLSAREMQTSRAAAEAMVERARARREWRPDASPEVVLAALVGARLHRALLEHIPLTPSFLRQVVDFTLAGVAPRASSR